MVERLLALGVLTLSGAYLATAWSLPAGTVARPGPGFFPVIVGVFGAAVALTWVLTVLRRQPAAAGGPPTLAAGRRRVGATTALLVGFCLALPWTGYPPAAFLFTGLLLRALGAAWPAALAIALAGAAVSFYGFAGLLGVPLPRGALAD